jgi:hypothetical protein
LYDLILNLIPFDQLLWKRWGTAQLLLSPLFWLGDFRMTHYKPALFIKPSQYYTVRFVQVYHVVQD